MTAADRPSVTDDARAVAWDQYVPIDLVHKVVNRLMRGGRDDLILANEVNTLLGASARRRVAARRWPGFGEATADPRAEWAAGRAETTTATTEDITEALYEATQDPNDIEVPAVARRLHGLLSARGLLATARTRPTLAEISLRLALEMDCERVYDDNANAYYCNEHDVGWLSDTNQCARAERLADAVLALWADQPTEAEAGARALVHAAGDHFHAMVAAGAGNPSEVSTWLRERAARLRGGAR